MSPGDDAMMNTRKSGVPDAFMQLLDAQMRFGADLFETFTGQAMPSLRDAAENARGAGERIVGRASGCEPARGGCAIPPPCWMPRPLGECVSHVSQCRTACVRLVVTNQDRVARTVTAEAAGANAGTITLSPPSLTLGPMERGTISACVAVPDDAKGGERTEALLWVRGCREYYLRWTVSVGTAGLDSCHEVAVCDGPDYLHHWYDHFYCARPCPPRPTPQPQPQPQPVPVDPNRPPVVGVPRDG